MGCGGPSEKKYILEITGATLQSPTQTGRHHIYAESNHDAIFDTNLKPQNEPWQTQTQHVVKCRPFHA